MEGKVTSFKLNGDELINYISDDRFTLRYDRDEKTGAITIGTSSEITITGYGFDVINGFYFNNPRDNFSRSYPVEVQVQCCGLRTYQFVLDSDAIVLCPDNAGTGCAAICILRQPDEFDACYRQLIALPFWKVNNLESRLFDRNFFEKLSYIASMQFTNWVLYILWRSAFLITFPLGVISDIFGSNNAINRVEDWLVGAGRFQLAFNVANVIKLNVERCNLRLDSPTLNSEPFSRMYWLEAQYDNGIDERHKNTFSRVRQLWENNAPNRTTINLLEELKPVFNHELRVIGNTLVFDFKENIAARLTPLWNIDEKAAEVGVDYCIKYKELSNYAYGRFEYTNDSMETEGNKAASIYNDIVEWNQPPRVGQRDELTNIIKFAPVRAQQDELQRRYDTEEIVFTIEEARRSGSFGRVHLNELFLSNGYAFVPKLLILDNEGKLSRRAIGSYFGYTEFAYNEFMRFLENGNSGNLYNRFHERQNPRKKVGDYFEIESYTIPIDCETLDAIEQYRLNLSISSRFGLGQFTGVEINFTEGTITFEGITI